MPLPIPSLDDRRFDDLVAEAITRIEAHTPEWSNIAPGDPGSALIDMFAWLAETILYRQNLIPLRQRRAFMNLLGMPLRPAAPATGVVCVDAGPLPLPAPVPAGQAQFNVGQVTFTSTTDLQPTPLSLVPMIKARHIEADASSQARLIALLQALYNYDQPVPFVARPAFGPDGTLHLADALDNKIWLALVMPKGFASAAGQVQAALAAQGVTLAMGLAPVSDIPGTQAFDQATNLPARTLNWAVVSQDSNGGVLQIPLEVVADTSNGGRAAGVALLRLPSNAALLAPPPAPNNGDPMYAGTAGQPPELPVDVTADRLVMWLTLTTADPAFSLGWLGVNAVGIIGQAIEIDEPLGTATGEGDVTFTLSGKPVDPTSLVLQVWPQNAVQPQTWTRVDDFGGAGRNDTVYVLDATAGTVTFGDGIRGMRPPSGAVIVAARYAYGGGSATNLLPGTIKAIQPSTAGTVRHEWRTAGGSDAESVTDAERRIPTFLANRDRAVTADDFQALAKATPGVTVGRATVAQGLMPGADAAATRTGVPGVVSVFVWPSQPIAFGNGPVASLAQLQLVFAWLRQRILIGTQLFVLAAEPVPIYAAVGIRVLNGADALAAAQGVQQALAAYLWPLPPGGPDQGGWALGRTVASDELLTQAARVAGVLAADQVVLYRQSGGAWSAVTSVTLQPWQVPALQGVGVSTDGSGAPAPPPLTDAGTPSGQTLVPIVPKTC
jgi:Baseplate J-like protein